MTKEDPFVESSHDGSSVCRNYSPVSSDSERAVVYPVASAPMPTDCDFSFFDPQDPACQRILHDPKSTISELFAILRQWVPQVQQEIDVIGNEILNRGCHVNDRDGLTDMTLLHYACKAGAQGIGDAEIAAKFAAQLIDMGADVTLRSCWTNMNALHYAAYFDVPELIRVVLKGAKPGEVDATCSDFSFGTSLHIAASNLCLSAVKSLLEHGANPVFKNDKGQLPADIVPDPLDMPLEMADAAAVAKELKQLLLDELPLECDISMALLTNYDHISGKALLMSLGLKLGERVMIAGQKLGTLRFCGTTEFASGQWAGIELDEPEGKNDGSVGGIQYFSCPDKYGIFAPLSKVSKGLEQKKSSTKNSPIKNLSPVKTLAPVRSQRMDLSHVTSKINTGLPPSKKHVAKRCTPPIRDISKPQSGTEASLPGSTCSSSSTSSVESRQSRQRQPPALLRNLSQPKKPAKKPTPAMTRTATGLRKRAPSVGNLKSDDSEIQIGDSVVVVGQRSGVVRFYGKTDFAPGYWYGIELDKPNGKNDGSVGGVQYFTCPPKRGVFAPPSRVQRLTKTLDSLSDIPSGKLNHSFLGFQRSYSSSSALPSPREPKRKISSPRPKNAVLRRSWSSANGSAAEGTVKLQEGSQVLLTSSNEIGAIRYIGPTEFAPGVWLGLELRSPKGKNDGSVGEKRYFTCKSNHGVLVRPSRVTYRGINGGKLVDDIPG
ncbi:CAP-Gly domain-containing linker protein 4 isoform X1 [Callorhinchus milii]|nr:CAP-Gly domain-containing linker protein 4 isoform X1 [Callorhinchus milii]XP_007895016.1 CAP-Gly domain-containing linker protein 4 isoform X1 [Callorhinchus milii]XP_042188737.1 CAP-Gly domain-containing linker protein 4 isoform X1 [Callorhinchus milii]|eukprot:gi/632958392/ref/XP_007895016.1/ PREDICTED: CAP-Gly domain-containing linker protein 4 isoform X3 [Callorhinchus milii]